MRSVDVYALTQKQVQRYAIAVGAGFVGGAGSISVWSIGAQPTTTYSDAGGGPQPAPICTPGNPGDTWCPGQTYNKGDTVIFSGVKYGSMKEPNVGHQPGGSPTFCDAPQDSAQHNGGGGRSVGDADGQATGGGGGYQSILGPAGAGDASGNANTPDNRIQSQVGGTRSSGVQGNLKTNGNAQGNITGNALAAAPIPQGTSAALNGNVIAGGDVNVRANENLDVDGIAGTAAGGVVAIGAAILILNIGEHVDAGVGGTVGGVTVSATDNLTADCLVISVNGGVGAGLSAALAFVDLSGKAAATSGAHGPVGAGGLSVTANGTRSATVQTVNVATGAIAVGITVARVNNSRSTEAGRSPTANTPLPTPPPAALPAPRRKRGDRQHEGWRLRRPGFGRPDGCRRVRRRAGPGPPRREPDHHVRWHRGQRQRNQLHGLRGPADRRELRLRRKRKRQRLRDPALGRGRGARRLDVVPVRHGRPRRG